MGTKKTQDQQEGAWLGHAVLFVMNDSLYKSLGCDCYDAERDAMTYTGNAPVVAHPPCQLWGKMANVNYARWGGEHNKPGNDGGCFRFALDAVNRCGGVLEHPAETYAWPAHGLPRPTTGWTRWKQGWVCEVWQSAYGHRANKRTWLYCSGTDAPLHPRWERPTGTHQVGFHDQRGKAANKPTLSKREANATPPAFAHYLLELAATCAKWPNEQADRLPPDGDGGALGAAVPIPHKCPVCDGSGLVSRPPYVVGDQREWSSSSCGPWPCKSCSGSGLL